MLTVRNKTDRADETAAGEEIGADAAMSVETGDKVETALDAALDAVTYVPEIPPSRRE